MSFRGHTWIQIWGLGSEASFQTTLLYLTLHKLPEGIQMWSIKIKNLKVKSSIKNEASDPRPHPRPHSYSLPYLKLAETSQISFTRVDFSRTHMDPELRPRIRGLIHNYIIFHYPTQNGLHRSNLMHKSWVLKDTHGSRIEASDPRPHPRQHCYSLSYINCPRAFQCDP
jgi:hypothetical protein